MRDMLKLKAAPKHHQCPKPIPLSPSWIELKLNQQIASMLQAEVELE